MKEKLNLTEIFYYDETSPSCLRWAVNVPYRGLFGGSSLKRKVGDVAGCLQAPRKGAPYRWKIKYQQKAYMAHRVVYELHFGPIDSQLVIDHIDGNPENNKIENLRLVGQSVNARNVKKNRNNKTGTSGVTYRVVNNFEYYAAAWSDLNGKQKNKYFSINKLGEELALFLAEEYRQHQIDLLNLAGAGYTDRHGTKE